MSKIPTFFSSFFLLLASTLHAFFTDMGGPQFRADLPIGEGILVPRRDKYWPEAKQREFSK